MVQAISEGMILGLILSFLIGPVFFLLIQTSMKEGMRSSMFLIAGIFISDVFCILLAYFGLSEIFNDVVIKQFTGLVGGLIMIVFGLFALLKKPKIHLYDVSTYTKTQPLLLFIKGFLLNTTNPFVFLFWLGSMGVAMNEFRSSQEQVLTYFSATMATVFCFDLLKAYSARKLSEKIKPQKFLIITRISGAGIIVFGLVLIFRVFNT